MDKEWFYERFSYPEEIASFLTKNCLGPEEVKITMYSPSYGPGPTFFIFYYAKEKKQK